MSNYTAAYIIKALSQLLPKYESRTWDAKTRKLLSYQIVISGKIREVLKCDPRSIPSMRSIRSTDCSVISEGGRPVQDNFQDHQSQLDVGDVCDLFSFTIYFTIVRGQKEVIFAKTAQAYFLCTQDVKLYSCLHHQSTESLLLNFIFMSKT